MHCSNWSNSSLDVAATAQSLASSTYFRIMLYFRLIIAVLGIFLVSLIFKFQGKNFALHPSARVLLISHHIWTILQSGANVLVHTFNLIRLSPVHNNPCDYLLTTPVAVLIRGPDIFSVYGQAWAFAAMTFERLIATIYYRSYEKQSSAFGLVLTLIQWLLTVVWFMIVIDNLDWSEMKAHSTVSSQRTAFIFSNLFWILAATEMASLTVFCGLLRYNKRKKMRIVGNASLTEKYQINENVRAVQLMIPLISTHFCCFMPTLLLFPIYINVFNPKLDPGGYAIFLESVNFIAFYPVLFPVVLFWRHNVLRENMRRAISFYQNNMLVGTNPGTLASGRTAEQIHHFESLKQMWASPKHLD